MIDINNRKKLLKITKMFYGLDLAMFNEFYLYNPIFGIKLIKFV